MCILKYKDNDEVIKRANNSEYGLGAGVVSENASELQYFIDKFNEHYKKSIQGYKFTFHSDNNCFAEFAKVIFIAT